MGRGISEQRERWGGWAARVYAAPMRCWRIYSGCPKGAGGQLTLGFARIHIDVCCDDKEVEKRIRKAPIGLVAQAVLVRRYSTASSIGAAVARADGSSGGRTDSHGGEEDAEYH